MLARLRRVDAIASARPGLFMTGYERLGGYPAFVDRAEGPHLWDVDGNRYVDYLLGYGSVVLGHADAAVSARVAEAVAGGVNPILFRPQQLDLAERLVALIPCAEQVAFLKTGSDAIGAAVRLARAVTGRRHVLQWGLHGWHDWCVPWSPGVLDEVKAATHPFEYNDLAQAERLLRRLDGQVAAIVLMPYEIDPPAPGYLEGLRDLAHAHGALFVFDEVRSGFRIAMGGAQEAFGVVPDLAAFSKALANGHPISVLVGARRYMRRILDVGMTVTFYRSADGVAAALATIERLQALDGPARLAALGARLMAGIDEAARRAGVPARMAGFPATPALRFLHVSAEARDAAMRRFCNGMLTHGVLVPPVHHWFVCTSLQEEDVDRTVAVAGRVFDDLARA